MDAWWPTRASRKDLNSGIHKSYNGSIQGWTGELIIKNLTPGIGLALDLLTDLIPAAGQMVIPASSTGTIS